MTDQHQNVNLSEHDNESPPRASTGAHPAPPKSHKLSIMETSLALVATNIGGGILGIPYAFYHLGMINGILMCVGCAGLAHVSAMMYLATKDLTPRKYESIYELSYLLMGRCSIFGVSGTLLVSNAAMMIMYYIIIGDTISHLWA